MGVPAYAANCESKKVAEERFGELRRIRGPTFLSSRAPRPLGSWSQMDPDSNLHPSTIKKHRGHQYHGESMYFSCGENPHVPFFGRSGTSHARTPISAIQDR